mmetsp:Transcript_42366/g.77373  ORF Transcript_42366/g.77373 Transcript_42366/m.77373 type:complete len:241 (+) Transcript_42366:305-1027(+)
MLEHLHPEDTAQVWLFRLCEVYEIAIDKAADCKIDKCQEVDRWRQGTEDNPDAQIYGEAGTARSDAIVILVLWLRQCFCLGGLVHLYEQPILHQVHGTREICEVSSPLQDQEVHVEMRCMRHRLSQNVEDLERRLGKCLHYVPQRWPNGSDEKHEHHLEYEVPILEPSLSFSRIRQREAELKNEDQESWQECHHELQAQCWCEGTPQWLKRSHVDFICDLGDPNDQGQIAHVKSSHKAIT